MTARTLRTAQVRVAELSLPADTAYVAVLRMTTAGLAARLDFTLDDIEDLRMAVGEACTLLLHGLEDAGTGGEAELRSAFELAEDTIRVRVSVDPAPGAAPDQASFGWQVLCALADDVHAESAGDAHTITFTVTSETA